MLKGLSPANSSIAGLTFSACLSRLGSTCENHYAPWGAVMNKKILVVDDEPEFLKFIEHILRQYCPGYRLDCCTDGQEAVEKAVRSSPDLILLDVSLITTDGFAVCRQLKSRAESADIPVLMVSGALTEKSHRVHGMEVGADGYILKPFHPLELVSQVRALLRARDASRQGIALTHSERIRRIEAIGLLAAGIAHDFNNMLTAVLGNISFVRSFELDREQQMEALAEAEAAAVRAKELAEHLLGFSRGGETILSPIHLAPVLRAAAEHAIIAQGGKVRYAFEPDLWLAVGDPERLLSAFMAVMAGAFDRSSKEQEIVVSTGNVRIESSGGAPEPHLKAGNYVSISIHDNSVIPPDQVPHLFEPFRKEAKAASRSLGFAIAQAIVRQHDGAITVASKANEGTTVQIFLAAVAPMQSAAKVHATDSTPSKSHRLLVMDDEGYIRNLLARALTMRGYQVDTAKDGESAIQMFRDAVTSGVPYGLVILDLTMAGGMGAVETLPYLQKLDPSVRAIVSSAYLSDPVIQNYREHGFCGVAVKPYDLSRLLENIEKNLAGS